MAEVEYATTARLPIATIWDFVQEMDNWAPFVTGYQQHEKQSETDSVWTLKGDLGAMARVLKFHVHITEWNGPERVSFELKGLNEPMDGSGTFLLSSGESASSESPGSALAAPPPVKQGFFTRLFAAIARFFFRLRHGRVERAEPAPPAVGAGIAKLHFRLRLEPGGPMAPMINAMITPLLQPAAENLADRIMATLEEREQG